MKKLIILYCISAWVGLGACSVYKSYERPDMPVVDSLYRQAAATSADTTSIASLSWRELFTDPKLQALIETGLQNNTDLNIARLKVTEAEATLMTSRLAYLPSISFEPSGTLRSVDGNAMTKSYDIAASASWEVDIFGKLTNAKRGAKAALEQSEAYRQAVQTQLIATIANSYYSLLMLDAQLDISERTAANWGENVRAMKALKAAGDATELAVAQSEASKLSVDASIASLRQQIDQMENTLTALLGIAPQKIDRTTIGEQRFPTELAAGVPLQLLQRRPDIREAEESLRAAMADVGMAYADRFPRLRFTVTGGVENDALRGLISSPFSYLSGQLAGPIFSFGAKRAKYRAAMAAYDASRLGYEQKVLTAFREVNDAIVAYRSASRSAELKRNLREASRKYVELTQLQYISGDIRYIDFLDAERSFFDAQVEVNKAVLAKYLALVELYKALGGGWQSEEKEA